MREEAEPGRRTTLVSVAALVVILAGLHTAAVVVVPLALAFVVTVIVAPLQRRLVTAGWHRIAAFMVVLLVTVLGLAAIFWTLDLSLSAFVADLPSYKAGGVELLDHLLAFGKLIHLDLTHLVRAGVVVGSAISQADTLTRGLLASIAEWAVVIAFTGFMLYEALEYPEKARMLVRDEHEFQRLVRFAEGLGQSMVILTIGAALTAAGDLAVLLLLGIPSALLWAVLAFLLSYVPNVGSIVIVIPPTIATLVRFGFGRAIGVLLFLLLIDNVVGVVVVPRLVRRRLSITPLWGLFSAVFWGWLLGPFGAILALPLTMAAKFLLEGSPGTAAMARLMAPLRSPTGSLFQ